VFTFVVFPLLILTVKSVFDTGNSNTIWLGIFYLAVLPSTVSSSVVMVSIAEGNIPAAIFNASISSMLGVFLTPIWMGIFLHTSSTDFNLGPIILKLILQVLVPVILGLLLHNKLKAFSERNKNRLKMFDQITILMIVYTSFCDSFAKKMFSGYSVVTLVYLGIAMVLLFWIIFFLINSVSRFFKFNREDKITAIFCGSKKSLVHGTVMSKVLFSGGNVAIGVVLLPIMMYHALQLVMASVVAKKWKKEKVSK
jgi:solute carrier family 10 (sodium/bile acid cotransporter), member 7